MQQNFNGQSVNVNENTVKKKKSKKLKVNQKRAKTVKDNNNDFIEDYLDKPGTIYKAKIHGRAQRILKIPRHFDKAKKVEFCNDCYLPQKTKGIVDNFPYCVDPKEFSYCGYNVYLFFFFMKYLLFNLISVFIIISLPFMILSYKYSNELFDFCTEYYVTGDTTPGTPETNYELCVNFVSKKEYDYTSFDWINRFSGESMIIYVKIIKHIFGKEKVDDVVVNFNFISFVGLILLLLINMLYVNLSEALVNEIDFNEESPSDYTLMISDIPKERTDPKELMDVFLYDENIKFNDINLTYQLTNQNKLKESLREKRKERRMNLGKEEYQTGYLCCKKKKKMVDLEKEIHQIITQLNANDKKVDETFNGVAFLTFNTETEKEKYYKLFPHSFLHKVFSNLKNAFCLYTCCCFLSPAKKRKLRIKQILAVSKAPEPQDIIWENLEYHFLHQLWRKCLGYFISIILIGISFGLVLGLNYLQYKSEEDLENNLFLKYGLSLVITIVTSGTNYLISMLFKKFSYLERPWSYTNMYLNLSIKLTLFTFINSAIVPLVSNIIQYGWDTHEVLVNNMLMTFLCGSILAPAMSLSCYDYIMYRAFRWFFVERKYKDQDERKPILEFTQRDLNYYYEYPDMCISVQYSTLAKQMLMMFFYLPIFPLGCVITFVGVLMTYLVEKLKCVKLYKRPEMLNQEICFFFIDFYIFGLFCLGVGNYIFFHDTHTTRVYELINIIMYPILGLIPYNELFRKCDSSGAFNTVNEITYENAYFSFSFDYERLNPMTQKQGGIKFLTKLEERGIITKKQLEIFKKRMNEINLMDLYLFANEASKYRPTRGEKKKEKKPKQDQSGFMKRIVVPLPGSENKAKEEEKKKINECEYQFGQIEEGNGYYNDKGNFFKNSQMYAINAMLARMGITDEGEEKKKETESDKNERDNIKEEEPQIQFNDLMHNPNLLEYNPNVNMRQIDEQLARDLQQNDPNVYHFGDLRAQGNTDRNADVPYSSQMVQGGFVYYN